MSSVTHPNKWWVLAAVLLSFLPIVIDTTILHIAVPSLTQSLAATGDELLWIIDIYPLIMAGLLVPMGTLADRIGPRRMLLTGLLVFLAASLAAAFSPSAEALIASRAFLAVGGAMVIPPVLAIIRNVFTDSKERGIALGLWGTVGSAGAAIGPIAGGALLEHFWWGSVFLVNVPVMLLLWPFVWKTVPEYKSDAPGDWKIGQALLLIAGLLMFVYGLKSSIGGKVDIAISLVALVGGLSLIGWFAWLQHRADDPMLDLALIAKPAICMGILVAMVVSGALSGVELTIAQELQYVVGKSPLDAGLFMLPLMIAAGIGGPFAGWVVAKVGLRLVMTTSLLASSLSLLALGFADYKTDGLAVAAYFVVLGLALSMGMTGSSIAIMDSVDENKAAAAGSLEGTGYELGVGLGIAAFGGLLASAYRGSIILPQGAAETAAHSIGETFIYASTLPGGTAEAIRQAGRLAFVDAHKAVLWTAAFLIALLAAGVWRALRHFAPSGQTPH